MSELDWVRQAERLMANLNSAVALLEMIEVPLEWSGIVVSKTAEYKTAIRDYDEFVAKEFRTIWSRL